MIFIETVPQMYPRHPQLWMCLSGSGAYYGGCQPWLSTDGGNSYDPLPPVIGRQTEGVVYSSNYPSHADPDNTDTLHVDLSKSLGQLSPVTSAQQNVFTPSLCYLQGGGTVTVNGQTLTIPYELVAYQSAVLAAPYKYALGPPIRRGVYGTPIAAHNIGSQFSFLNDGLVAQLDLNASMQGVTLYFKFTAFNLAGGNQEALSQATAYTFAPTGQVGWNLAAFTSPASIPFPTGVNINAASDIPFYVAGTYSAGQELLRVQPARQSTYPASLIGSLATCDTAPTLSIQITINKNGSPVGTVNFAAGSTTGSFTSAGFSINGTGDILTFIGPNPADVSFAGANVTIWGTRSN